MTPSVNRAIQVTMELYQYDADSINEKSTKKSTSEQSNPTYGIIEGTLTDK
jgi:hypothetical protein